MISEEIEVRVKGEETKTFPDVYRACKFVKSLPKDKRHQYKIWDCSGGFEMFMFAGDYQYLNDILKTIK